VGGAHPTFDISKPQFFIEKSIAKASSNKFIQLLARTGFQPSLE
jgi:hypothetical protein